MEALVQRLAPPPAHVDPDEYNLDGDGEGNLNALGVVRGMQVPRVPDPAAFLSTYTNSMSQNPQAKIKLEHGTTTLAFRFRGGIIVSVDSRATAGSYIASGTVKKVIEINKYLLGTMAGGAADCQYWETYLGMRCRMHELRNKERISVAAASKILANIVYEYKGQGLSMGTMICGWDKTGPQIFYVDSEGTRLKGNVFAVGSGATFAYGVLDQGYSWDLSDEDAQELGRRAIVAAGHRDAYSGNTNNLFHVREDGWEFLGNKDISELWYKYEQEKKDARATAGAGAGAGAGTGAQGENAARPTTEVQPVPMEE